jgi:RND family efflux transporter MFP subunit
MNKVINCLLVSITIITFGCSDKNKNGNVLQQDFVSSIPKVKTTLIKTSSFSTGIHSNGKLEAIKKVDLKFENEGIIQQVFVHDGDEVRKGQMIAYQSSNHLLSESNKNKEVLTKARLNMEDILLGFGYSLKDSLEIPKEIMNMARSRSGISDAKNQIIQAQKKYTASRITAPFSGIIANVNAKKNSLSSLTDNVCTLIDNKELLVNFYILEKEFGLVSKGNFVTIFPIALPGKKAKGVIKYINPVVDENGLILIKASIENKDNTLIDGMNVNVSVKHTLDDVISIPKKAIVDRQDRKVVFIYKNGKSQWNYVKLGQETRDSIVVTEGLKTGDHIIIDGNVNLAHDTQVERIE